MNAPTSGSSPAKNSCARTILSSVSILPLHECGGFGGDVDADRAPGNATPAADTAGTAELIPPMRQLMGHPLAVARARLGTHGAPVHVGEVAGEAGIPAPHALGALAVEVAVVLDGGAEAGRAHHGAVG